MKSKNRGTAAMTNLASTSIQRVFGMILLIGILGGCAHKPSAYPFDIEVKYQVKDPEFERVAGFLMRRPLLAGNSIKTLKNGVEIFPAMIEAIQSAQNNIVFETFIYWSGDIAEAFADALIERAQNGVEVKVLVDAVGGSRMSDELVQRLLNGKVDFRFYKEIEFFDFATLADANFRTHRKIMVVDGRIGFTGGVGIGDKWLGDGNSPDEWRENHYELRGPVVSQLQSAFFDNWVDTTGEVLHGEGYYPKLEPIGALKAQVTTSSSDADGAKIQLMLLLGFAAAREEILMATPYFVPDDLTIREIIRACERGVKVHIMIPGEHIDFDLVRRASRTKWRELLEAGVKISKFQPTMLHCKLLIIDNLWTTFGSANVDNRSFSINDEVNINVLDEDFAREQKAIFENDLKSCIPATIEDLEERGLFDRIADGFASWFAPQL